MGHKADFFHHMGRYAFVFNAEHFLPHGNYPFAERQKQDNVVPIAYAVIYPAVRRVHHITEDIVNFINRFRLACQPEQY